MSNASISCGFTSNGAVFSKISEISFKTAPNTSPLISKEILSGICNGKLKNENFEKYKSKISGDLEKAQNLISENIDLTKYSDTLFSAQTDVYNKLVNLKASPLIFDKWGNVVADDPESGVYNI